VRKAAFLLLAGVVFGADEPAKIKLPTRRDDLARGEKLFGAYCALCHGTKGGGGRGPILATPKLKRAPDDAALVKVVEDGIQGTEMPGAWHMTPREIRQVSAFVRGLGRVPDKPVPGDIARGSQLYQAKGGCAACHTVQGKGGLMGPDLTSAGLRRSAAFLREAILNPEAELPDRFLQVRVVPHQGSPITGIRLGEDSFTIQVRDFSDNLHSFWKRDLKDIHKDHGRSPMPAYKDKFSDAELTDLVAYLASLREEK